MKTYKVDCTSNGLFYRPQEVNANTPKEAAEKVVGRKVKRMINGGNIVVGGWDNAKHYARYRTYVYEVEE